MINFILKKKIYHRDLLLRLLEVTVNSFKEISLLKNILIGKLWIKG